MRYVITACVAMALVGCSQSSSNRSPSFFGIVAKGEPVSIKYDCPIVRYYEDAEQTEPFTTPEGMAGRKITRDRKKMVVVQIGNQIIHVEYDGWQSRDKDDDRNIAEVTESRYSGNGELISRRCYSYHRKPLGSP